MRALVWREWRSNNKIGFVANVGGLCAKGGDSWRWLGHLCVFVGGVRVCVLLCVCVCRFKTHPCVDSKHLRVCRPNARVRHGPIIAGMERR